jgi:hypothetical protein
LKQECTLKLNLRFDVGIMLNERLIKRNKESTVFEWGFLLKDTAFLEVASWLKGIAIVISANPEIRPYLYWR